MGGIEEGVCEVDEALLTAEAQRRREISQRELKTFWLEFFWVCTRHLFASLRLCG